MKKTSALVIVFLLLTSLLVAGCAGSLRGSGELITEDYALSDFTGIDINTAFDVEISMSDGYAVSVTVDDNILERVRVEKSGDTLKIGMRSTPRLVDVTLKAEVTMPLLRELRASGASHAAVSGFSSTENLSVDLSGASSISGSITAGETDVKLSGASTVELKGSASNLKADASGASHLRLADFPTTDADVSLDGSSDGTVNLTGRLDADLSGSAELSYIGEPTMGNISTSGSSKIKKE